MVRLTDLSGLARRRAAIPRPGADITDLTNLDLIGVSLVAKAQQGAVEVPELSLFFDKRGLRVRRSDGSNVAAIAWSSLVSASTDAVAGGEYGSARRVTFDLTTDRRRHRFVVPYANAPALGAAINTLSTRYVERDLVAPAKAGMLRRRT